MKKFIAVAALCALIAGAMVNLAGAGPFTVNVATDVYGVAQGGSVNGIPTANDNNDGTPDIYQAVNQILGTSYTNNYQVDPRFTEPDEIWQDISGGRVILIGLTAGNTNTLGVYTDLGAGMVKFPILTATGFGFIGDGSFAKPYPAGLTGLSAGTPFGWYLHSVTTAGVANDYYSEPWLNAMGLDHMMTFDLADAAGISFFVNEGSGPIQVTLNHPYLITWEDLPFSNSLLGDEDYDDMIYLIDKVSPVVPAPGAILLAGLGTGLVGWLRNRKTL
ncbi:MAG: hypothetical protein GX455_07040 [Phycisphaerae bacterium]|nr:hypothetical protein [Phycisphaerae bacterium]